MPHFYDPLMAKLIVHGTDRRQAVERLDDALGRIRIAGIRHNVPFLRRVVATDEFAAGDYTVELTEQLLKQGR